MQLRRIPVFAERTARDEQFDLRRATDAATIDDF
jgi:hypothetical protein